MNRLFIFLILSVAILSLSAGTTWIAPSEFWGGTADGWVVRELRAPRLILALCIGAALGLSGAALQGYARNPLADASVLGISSSASLGAVISIFLGSSQIGTFTVPFAAMAGAIIGMIFLLTVLRRSPSTITFILAGVMLNIMTGAALSLLISLSKSPYALSEILTWMMGALTDRSWREVFFAVPFILIGCALLLKLGNSFDALSLGENTGRTLGLNPSRTRLMLIAGVGLAVGAAVSVSGVIGFVGLIIPHFIRRFVGEKPSRLLVPSALGGGLFLMSADLLVRLLPTATEMKLGIIMALIGGPLFLLVLRRTAEHTP
jgi:iron complex transport system permease protein